MTDQQVEIDVNVLPADAEIDLDLDTELLEPDLVADDDLEDESESESDEAEDETEPLQQEDEADESEQEPAEPVKLNPVRQLREANKELAKKLKLQEQEQARLKAQLETLVAPKAIELPPEPNIDDDDIAYDPELFKKRYAVWNNLKIQVEQQQQAVKQKEQEQQAKFNQRLQSYEQSKLNYKGMQEAESVVLNALDINQQGMVVQYADDPALVVLALGKNPVLLNQLASIKDPIEYAIKMRDVEQKARDKMATNKRTPPPPEKRVTTGGTVKTNHDKVLDKLRSEGKYGEAMQYRKKHGLM